MARVINTTGQTVSEGNSNRYLPLKAGEYTVSFYDVEEGTYKADSAGTGRDNYRLQLRVADGQEGANRRLFETVGLFSQWGPTAKNPDGSDNFTFFDVFSAVRGVKSKDFRYAFKADSLTKDSPEYAAALAGISDEAYRSEVEASNGLEIPDPTELVGKKVNVVLKIVPDKYAYNKAVTEGTLEAGQTQQDFLTNAVSAWKPATEVTAPSASVPADAFVL